jgi:hypothetical protein
MIPKIKTRGRSSEAKNCAANHFMQKTYRAHSFAEMSDAKSALKNSTSSSVSLAAHLFEEDA